MRKQHRAAFAAGLLSALQDAPWTMREPWSQCHDIQPADLQEDGVDEMCRTLSLLGMKGRLSELVLKDVLISEGLFWGSQGETWPALRRFHIQTGLAAVSGKWWYTGNRNDTETWLDMNSDEDESDGHEDRLPERPRSFAQTLSP